MQIYRGDIFYIENNFHSDGAIISGSRPEIIVSNNLCNKHSDFVEIVYLTSKEKKPLPTHVTIICKTPSTALCEQIFTVSKKRIGDFVRSCNEKEMKAIDTALKMSLGLDGYCIKDEYINPTFNSTNSELCKKIDELDYELKESDIKIKALECGRQAFEDIIKEQAAEIEKLRSEKEMLKELYNQLLEKAVG